MTGPSFSTVSSARSRWVRVRTTTPPPWTLWRTAFSTRLTDEAVEQPPVAADAGGLEVAAHAQAGRSRLGAHLVDGQPRGPREVGGLVARRHALAAGQGQQPADEVLAAIDRLRDDARHRPQVGHARVGVGERHVELGPDDGQRPAQLVAGLGDEPALRGERVAEPLEHRVEGVGELAQLVAWAHGADERRARVARCPSPAAQRR